MAKYDFLKLTKKRGIPVYIEVGHISSMIRWDEDERTDVYLTGDPTPVDVMETPDKIIELMSYFPAD